jgi:hypothetical protein
VSGRIHHHMTLVDHAHRVLCQFVHRLIVFSHGISVIVPILIVSYDTNHINLFSVPNVNESFGSIIFLLGSKTTVPLIRRTLLVMSQRRRSSGGLSVICRQTVLFPFSSLRVSGGIFHCCVPIVMINHPDHTVMVGSGPLYLPSSKI